MPLFAQNPPVEIVSRKMVRVDNGDGTFDQFDIAKIPGWAPRAGWYPVELSGSGSMPDVSALSFDGSKFAGEYVPSAAPRKVTYLEFRKRIIDAGVDMGQLRTIAQTDGTLMDFLVCAENTSDRMIELDNTQDTIPGLMYIETNLLAGATAGFSDAVRA